MPCAMRSHHFYVFWYCTSSWSLQKFSEDKKVDFNVNNDGNWHDYSIFVGSQPPWTGTIIGIRIDPANNDRKGGEVDSIGFDHIRVEHSHIIMDRSIYPNTASAGDELTFVFNIDNPFSNEISKARLGARIRTHNSQGEWIDDMPNDAIVTLKPGARLLPCFQNTIGPERWIIRCRMGGHGREHKTLD